MSDYSIYISGVDKTDYIVRGSLAITDEINAKVNTCTFKTIDASDTWKPDTSETLTVYDPSSNKIFAGIITSVDERRVGINPGTSNELLEYTVNAQDYTRLLQKRLVVESFEGYTCHDIIQAIIDKYFSQEGFTLTNVNAVVTVTKITFNYKAGDKCIDDLAKAAGCEWYVDYDKDIHFFIAEDAVSVATFSDSTTNWTNLTIKPDTTQLRNRVYVRGGIYHSDLYTQDIEADGTAEVFLLAYTPFATNDGSVGDFTISALSATRTVGLKDIDEITQFDFLLNRAEKAVSMGQSAWALANTPLAAGTIITASYSYEIPVLIVQEDSTSIASMIALEGGDGVYESLIVDKNISSIEEARLRAAAELSTYANAITRGSVDSYDTVGIKSGDLITINSSRRGVNADYLVTRVKITSINSSQLKYSIEFTGTLYNFVDFLLALYKRSTEILIGQDEILDAFNSFVDTTNGFTETVPAATLGAPPYAWSNDAGTTPNKMRWSLFEWA